MPSSSIKERKTIIYGKSKYKRRTESDRIQNTEL